MLELRPERTPLVIILADGWNHSPHEQERWAEYVRVRKEFSHLCKVSQLKIKCWEWKQSYQIYMPKKRKWAAWEELQLLLTPLEESWGQVASGAAAALRTSSPPPVVPAASSGPQPLVVPPLPVGWTGECALAASVQSGAEERDDYVPVTS